MAATASRHLPVGAIARMLQHVSPRLNRPPFIVIPGPDPGMAGSNPAMTRKRELMSDTDLLEAVELERTADWRIRKLGENPSDRASETAAKLLQKLADDV